MEDTVIFAAPEMVSGLLLDIDAWPNLMPHVRNVRTTYDDGTYQEFTMDVEGVRGKFVPVRSVRRNEPGHIAYFMPGPPSFLKHCCGDWFIRSLGRGATHLTIVLRWTPAAGEASSEPDGVTASARIEALLGERSKATLAAVKEALEPDYPVPEIGRGITSTPGPSRSRQDITRILQHDYNCRRTHRACHATIVD